jgi:hypothetical protein
VKYTIISVDDSRAENKNLIRSRLDWEEVELDFVDGRIPRRLKQAKQKWHDVDTPGPFKAGEFGVFYSVLTCLEYGSENGGILYFEDDAVPVLDFQQRLEYYLNEIPLPFDVFALWSPANQVGDYTSVSRFNDVGEPQYGQGSMNSIFEIGKENVSLLWQGYGNVSMCFTEMGCKRLLEYIKARAFFSPIDCLICIAVHGGYLKGYSLKPHVPVLIDYNWNTPTTVHHSRWGHIEQLMEEE